MLYFSVILLLATCLPYSQGKKNSYCLISKEHSMCKYRGIGKDCVDAGGSGVSKFERNEILNVHNYYRSKVAKGDERRGYGGPQPKAANLMKFTWDDELAKIAQIWADQCIFGHDVRDVERWKVGQNIYWKMKYPVHNVNWTEAIKSWYDEVAIFNPKDVSQYSFQSETGHYTQMLWHSTHKIGCGRRDYGSNKIYVCNYGPAGNWINEPMYLVGKPCSKCPSGTACENYLCARGTKSKEDEGSNELGSKSKDKQENEIQSKNNTNRLKIYLILYFDNKSYAKPISFLDKLLRANATESSTTNLIESENLDLNEEEKERIKEIKNKIEQLNKE